MAKTKTQPTPELIRIEDVDVMLEGQRILANIRWTLRAGEHWAILGRNGSGKSTFLKLVRGELWPAPGCRGRRLYAFEGEEQTTAVGIKELIALVSPELQARYLQQEWTLTALQVIRSGFHAGDFVYQRLTTAQENAVLSAIELVGVQDLLSRNVQNLSTGELRKVLVARAVVGKPRVLVCDEICDSLDSGARASLLGALERLAVRGTQLLYTTHREDELLPILTHRLCLDRGRIVSAEPISRTFERPEAQLPRAPGWGVAPVTPSRSRVPSRLGYGPRGANGSRRLPRLRIDIRAANVYLEQRQALFDVTWQIREGQHWAVLGPNGSGKTTLLKLIVGDLHPSLGGRVRRFEFTSKNTIWEVKQKMGWVSPELQSHYRESLTGAQVIGSGFHSSVGLVQPLTRAQWRRVGEVVECLGLQELARRNTLTLSYGEFRKILIARALVQRPELLVCDEPYDGLDTASRAAVARILGQVAGQGTGLVIVTHHLGELPPCTTHLATIESGRLVFQGPISDH